MKPFFLVSLSTIVNKIEFAVKNRGRAVKTLLSSDNHFNNMITNEILDFMPFDKNCFLSDKVC